MKAVISTTEHIEIIEYLMKVIVFVVLVAQWFNLKILTDKKVILGSHSLLM